MQPVLLLLLCSTLAAGAAAFGALPSLLGQRVPMTGLGWANAIAAGLMLAAAFVLTAEAVSRSLMGFGLGALGGILFVHWARFFFLTEDLDLGQLEKTDDTYGYQVLLAGGLHAATEGVGMGAAMAVDRTLGIFVAVAMALHNIPEATVLTAIFRARKASSARSATLGVFANSTQPLMAVSTYAIVAAAPAFLPWSLGLAAGAFIYLVMVDLLPESYKQAGPVTIALGSILAMVAFALMHGAMRG